LRTLKRDQPALARDLTLVLSSCNALPAAIITIMSIRAALSHLLVPQLQRGANGDPTFCAIGLRPFAAIAAQSAGMNACHGTGGRIIG
jgi:hypothetical protein